MSATLDIYHPLHCCCSLHIDLTLLHISAKNRLHLLFYSGIDIYEPATNTTLKCHIQRFPNCMCGISTRQLELLLWRAGLTAVGTQDCYVYK